VRALKGFHIHASALVMTNIALLAITVYAAAWTAVRIAGARARRIRLRPPIDAKGLRMEMWY
jgi:predicted RNase H-like nuclease